MQFGKPGFRLGGSGHDSPAFGVGLDAPGGGGGTPYIPVGPTYFVSAAGNDSNDGLTIDTPWKTIAKVNASTIPVGYNVAFRGGDTFAGNLVVPSDGGALANTIYCSFGIGRAIISADVGTGVDASDRPYITVTNLKLVGNGTTNDKVGILFQNNADDHSKIPGCQATHNDVSGFGRGGIAFFGNETYGDDPVLSGYIGFLIDQNEVDNCAFNWGISSAGIMVYADAAYGAKFNRENGHAAMPYGHQDATVTNNRVTNCPGKAGAINWTGSGIFIGQTHTATVERNYEASCGSASNFTSGPMGIWSGDSFGVRLRFNVALSNRRTSGSDGGGFNFDGGSVDCISEYNYSADNHGPGQMIFAYDDPDYVDPNSGCIVRYNISYNDATATLGSLFAQNDNTNGDFEGCVFHNNVIIQKGTNKTAAQFGGNTKTVVDVLNNILWVENGSKLINDAGPPLSGVRLRGNNYYAPGASGTIITWNSVNYTTIAAWRAASGQETDTGADTSVFGDPLFISSPAAITVPAGEGYPVSMLGGYKLQAGSPAKNAGKPISAVGYTQPATDYFGEATSQTTIGASASGTGSLSISPALLTSASQIFAPVVTPGPISVSPALLAAGGTIYSPTVSVASSYDSDATAYFAAMSVQPDATRKGLLNTLIVAWKATGGWAKRDRIWIPAAHDEQAGLLNVKNPAVGALSKVNSPAFATDRGFQGDGASSHLATGWAPSDGVQWQLNSASLGAYVNVFGASRPMCGRAAAGGTVLLQVDGVQVRMNTSASVFPAAAMSAPGWIVQDRPDASTVNVRVNGSQVNTNSQTSASLDTSPLFLLRVVSSYGNSRLACAFFGASTAAEDAAFYSALNTYLTAIGAN